MKPALALTHVFNRLRIETSFIDFFFNSFFLEVLGCFTDGVISLDQDSAAVLKDALLILSSKVQLCSVCDMHDSLSYLSLKMEMKRANVFVTRLASVCLKREQITQSR